MKETTIYDELSIHANWLTLKNEANTWCENLQTNKKEKQNKYVLIDE